MKMKKIKTLLPLIAATSLTSCLVGGIFCSCSNKEKTKIFESTTVKNISSENQIVPIVDVQDVPPTSFLADSVGTYSGFKYLGTAAPAGQLVNWLNENYLISVNCTSDTTMKLHAEFVDDDKTDDNIFNIIVHCSDLDSAANIYLPVGEYKLSLSIVDLKSKEVELVDSELIFQLQAKDTFYDFEKTSFFPSMSKVKYATIETQNETKYRPYVTVEYGGFWSFHSKDRRFAVEKCELKSNGGGELPENWEEKTKEENGVNYWVDESISCPGMKSIYCEYWIGEASDVEEHTPIDAKPFVLNATIKDLDDPSFNVWTFENKKVGVPLDSSDLEGAQGAPIKCFSILDEETGFNVEMEFDLEFNINLPSTEWKTTDINYSFELTQSETPELHISAFLSQIVKTTDQKIKLSFTLLADCIFDEDGEVIPAFDDTKIYDFTLYLTSNAYCPGVTTIYNLKIAAAQATNM